MNITELKKQILINFEKDEITEKERLINVMQCIDAHIEQLTIPNVSQQRELLIAYNIDFYKNIHDVDIKHIEKQVDKYLSNL
jgi:hypothetical protein